MRFVALAFILMSLPIFIALLTHYREKRDVALTALGVMAFLIGTLQIDAALITWRLWQGIARGIFISPIDMLAIALIVTRPGVRNRVPFLWLVLLFLVPSTMSIFVSAMPTASLFVPLQVLRMIILFVALAGELQRPSALRALMTGLAIGLIIQAGFVVQQKLTGVVQAKGTADHQNILGMMVEMAVIPLVALVMEGERRKLIYAGIVAGLIVVAGGGSRATMGFIAFGLVLVMFLSMVRRPTPRKGKVLGVAVLAAIVVVPLSLATLRERFGENTFFTQDEVRKAMEVAASTMASEHPLGVGANTYVMVANEGGYSMRAGVPWGGTSLTAPVHNSFLLMRAETGWLGQILLVALLVIPLIVGLRLSFTDRKTPLMGMGLASTSVMIVTVLHCNYEYAWHLEAVQRLYFMNLAVLSACVLLHRRTQSRKVSNRRARIASKQKQLVTDPSPRGVI